MIATNRKSEEAMKGGGWECIQMTHSVGSTVCTHVHTDTQTHTHAAAARSCS